MFWVVISFSIKPQQCVLMYFFLLLSNLKTTASKKPILLSTVCLPRRSLLFTEMADNTHTTVVTTTPQQYPQQPIALPGPSQGVPYQSATLQPGFAAQYGYPAQPMPTSPYHGQAFPPGPPPLYLEAIGPAYSSQPIPYSQVEFTHGQPAYPLKPLDQQQPDAPPASTAFQSTYKCLNQRS
uniref:Uncharacterized protein n=1 Tax=Oreochromis aureus TaxID=47969 RepID=A0AAZ1Y590_OREAU